MTGDDCRLDALPRCRERYVATLFDAAREPGEYDAARREFIKMIRRHLRAILTSSMTGATFADAKRWRELSSAAR